MGGKKKKSNFPDGVMRKKARISRWYKLNMDIIAWGFFISGQFLPKPKLVLWPSKSASLLPTQFTFNHPGWASFTEPLRNICCAVNSADWDRSCSFCSNGKFISVTGVSCHQSVPRTHIDINGSFAHCAGRVSSSLFIKHYWSPRPSSLKVTVKMHSV